MIDEECEEKEENWIEVLLNLRECETNSKDRNDYEKMNKNFAFVHPSLAASDGE